MKHGTSTAPGWVRVLEAAEKWGKLPWEIVERPGAVVWWLRWCVFRDVELEARKAKS